MRRAAAAQAQRQWTVPIFWPEVPSRLPLDSLMHCTTRQEETR